MKYQIGQPVISKLNGKLLYVVEINKSFAIDSTLYYLSLTKNLNVRSHWLYEHQMIPLNKFFRRLYGLENG